MDPDLNPYSKADPDQGFKELELHTNSLKRLGKKTSKMCISAWFFHDKNTTATVWWRLKITQKSKTILCLFILSHGIRGQNESESESGSTPRKTEWTEHLVCSGGIPVVPRNRKLSEFWSETFLGREKCLEFIHIFIFIFLAHLDPDPDPNKQHCLSLSADVNIYFNFQRGSM